jgi:hypothetical protein
LINLALINENNICIGVQQALSMIDDGRHVEIENYDFDYYVYRKYENGQWSEEKFLPESPQVELTRMEKLEQSQAEQDELIMQIMLGGV